MINKEAELKSQHDFQMKATIKAIFESIDSLIEKNKTCHPVPLEESKFYAEYKIIKARWIR